MARCAAVRETVLHGFDYGVWSPKYLGTLAFPGKRAGGLPLTHDGLVAQEERVGNSCG